MPAERTSPLFSTSNHAEWPIPSRVRTPTLQQLFDEAVRTYGSRAEARRRVSTSDEYEHVTGDAVDVGQTYNNEMLHYELATTPDGTCPELKLDAGS